MKRWAVVSLLCFAFLGLLFYGCGGGGGSGESSTYSLSKGNHVILGPIENATISIYKLTDSTKTPILTTQSGKLGTFKVSLPDSVSDSDLLLVEAKGGVDVDYDDNGVKDSKSTENTGILHCICKAKDLKSGTVNVTFLSDVVYQYTKHLIPDIGEKLSEDDFWMIVNTVSSQLVKIKKKAQNRSDVEPYRYILAFNPITQKDILSFDYSKLYEGDQNSIMHVYHTNKEKTLIRLLSSFFRKKGLILGDYRYENLRKNVKLTISYPKNLISSISIEGSDTEGNNISKTLTHSEGFFVPKGMNLTIFIGDLSSTDVKILKWHGCDSVSEDLKTCYVNNIQNDKMVTPIIVPTTVKLYDNVTVIDITGTHIEFSGSTDSVENPALIPVNSPLLDNITVYADLSDTTMRDRLASIKEGDIIVNKTFPVFFRKVVSINKVTDFRYKIKTEFVPLTKIVKRGYISTSAEGLSGSSGSGEKVSRALILPNGKVIPFDPNKSDGILINLSNGTASVSVMPKSKAIHWSTTATEGYGPIYLEKIDDDNYAKLKGSLTIMPKVDFDMSWRIGLLSGIHIDQVHAGVGTQLKVSNTLEVQLKKEFHKRISILKKPLIYSQVFTVGPIPVEVSEKIPLYCGVKGVGKGEEEDDASFEGKASITPNVGVDLDFILDYYRDGDKVIPKFNLTPYYSIGADIKASADIFAYVGAEPAIEVYGFGIDMENDVGPYVRASFQGSTSTTVKGTDSSAKIKVSGDYGLAYYGRLGLTSDWKISWIQALINTANELIRGKYTEYWKEWSWGTVNTTISSESPSHTAVKPGMLEVEGEDKVIETEEGSSSLLKTVTYKIKNTGDTPIYWKVYAYSPHPQVTVSINTSAPTTTAVLTGELKGGESTDIPIELSASSLHEGVYPVTVFFYQSEVPFAAMTPFAALSLFTPVSVKHISIKVIPPAWGADFKASLTGTTVRKIQFQWNKYPTNAVNGYAIFYGQYDNDTDTCTPSEVFAKVSSGDTTKYEMLLDQAVKLGLVSYGKSYCFSIFGMKSTGSSKTIYIPSSDGSYAIVKIPENTSEISGKEVDIDFLVDRTGSYWDDIDTFKEDAKNIVNTLSSSMPEGTTLKMGVTSFKDFPVSPYGGSEDFPFKLELNLTNDTSKFISVIDTLEASGGSDEPESQLEALYQSVKRLSWNPAAIKIILLFTDASFHDPDTEPDYPGKHGFKEVKELLTSNNFAVIGMASDYASEDLKRISNYVFQLSSDSSEVVDKIKELMLSIPGTHLSTEVTSKSRSVIEPKEIKVLPKSIWQGEPNF